MRTAGEGFAAHLADMRYLCGSFADCFPCAGTRGVTQTAAGFHGRLVKERVGAVYNAAAMLTACTETNFPISTVTFDNLERSALP